MAKTSAERQREFRQRRLIDGSDSRLNVVVSASAAAGLRRLAAYRGQSQKEVLEALVRAADSALLDAPGYTNSVTR
jgi:hypothetical protein